jgi:hypothetical protein
VTTGTQFWFGILAFAVGSLLGCSAAPLTPSPVHPDRARAAEAARLHAEGKRASERGDSVRAEQYLTAALRAGHDPRETLGLLLSLCLRNAHVRTALTVAEPHLAANPDDIPLRYLVATLKHSLKDHRGARRELALVLERAPDHEEAHHLLAWLEREEQPDTVDGEKAHAPSITHRGRAR